MTDSVPRSTLERHLTGLHAENCTCPHEWRALGILYGVSFGHGWVRLDDAEDCPVHAGDRKQQAAASERLTP